MNIDETVPIKIPRLLPEKTIKAIQNKGIANRTFQHGKPKYEYLLSGFIFCGICGYALLGQWNRYGLLYYRHRKHDCPIRPRPFVRADELDKDVSEQVFGMFANPVAVRRAVEDAIPNKEELKKAKQQVSRLEKELEKVSTAREWILNLIERDAITDAQASQKQMDLKGREQGFLREVDRLSEMLAEASHGECADPDSIMDDLGRYVDWTGGPTRFDREAGCIDIDGDAWDPLEMPFADRRTMLGEIFSSPLPNGQPSGIYVFPVEGHKHHRRKRWTYEIRGRLNFSISCDMLGECHAHHRFGVH